MAPSKKKAAKAKPKPKSKPKGKTGAEIKRHRDWEMNQELIFTKYVELALLKKSAPKIVDVARACNLSERTVHRHMDEMDVEGIKQKFRVFTEAALFAIAKNAVAGKAVEWSRMYFDIIHDLGSKKRIDITTNGKDIPAGTPTYDVSKLSTQTLMELLNAENTTDTSHKPG